MSVAAAIGSANAAITSEVRFVQRLIEEWNNGNQDLFFTHLHTDVKFHESMVDCSNDWLYFTLGKDSFQSLQRKKQKHFDSLSLRPYANSWRGEGDIVQFDADWDFVWKQDGPAKGQLFSMFARVFLQVQNEKIVTYFFDVGKLPAGLVIEEDDSLTEVSYILLRPDNDLTLLVQKLRYELDCKNLVNECEFFVPLLALISEYGHALAVLPNNTGDDHEHAQLQFAAKSRALTEKADLFKEELDTKLILKQELETKLKQEVEAIEAFISQTQRSAALLVDDGAWTSFLQRCLTEAEQLRDGLGSSSATANNSSGVLDLQADFANRESLRARLRSVAVHSALNDIMAVAKALSVEYNARVLKKMQNDDEDDGNQGGPDPKQRKIEMNQQGSNARCIFVFLKRRLISVSSHLQEAPALRLPLPQGAPSPYPGRPPTAQSASAAYGSGAQG
ncbi:unnamed protein product [Amoebophrya sp. A120]|nr:unnamed protein product [Amoebophrya sp. A120]|eukprot:GSA120T00020253001.1